MSTMFSGALDRFSARFVTWLLILVAYVAWMLRNPWSPADYSQQSAAIRALMHWHLSDVYPLHNALTSPPGFLILAAPVVAALGGSPTSVVAAHVVGMMSALFVAGAALRLARHLHPEPTPFRDRVLVTAVLFGSPFTYSLLGAYHPEDLVAMGFVLLATDSAVRRQGVGVGLALGAAVLTRQWALLATGPLLVYLDDGWRRAAGVGAVITGVVLAPFAILDRSGLVTSLGASNGLVTGFFSVWRFAHLSGHLAYAMARTAPLVLCIPTTIALRRRWKSAPSRWPELIGALVLTSGYRVAFDSDSLAYYIIPLACMLLLVGLYDPTYEHRMAATVVLAVTEFVLSYEPNLIYINVVSPWLSGTIAITMELAVVSACILGGLWSHGDGTGHWRETRLPLRTFPDTTTPTLNSRRS